MASSEIAILDFGSSKLSVLFGSKSQSGALIIKAKGISDYAGFMDGEFLEPNNLQNSIFSAVNEVEKVLDRRVKKVIVGVPPEFCFSKCHMLEYEVRPNTKIKDWHINKMFLNNKSYEQSDSHSVINRTALYYKLNDSEKVLNPIGRVVNKLEAYVSYVFAESSFINIVSAALTRAGVKKIDFLPTSFTQGKYLLTEKQRQDGAVIIDCGYITTGVTYFVNNGVADIKSFSLGGGHISSDLYEVLKINFNSAEQLKRKLVLTLQAGPKDYYEAIVNNKLTKFGAKIVNNVALARIEAIAETVLNAINDFDNELMPTTKIYLTGGGLSYIKGIEQFMTNALGYKVEIIAPKPLHLNKPDLSSEISLLDTALGFKSK